MRIIPPMINLSGTVNSQQSSIIFIEITLSRILSSSVSLPINSLSKVSLNYYWILNLDNLSRAIWDFSSLFYRAFQLLNACCVYLKLHLSINIYRFLIIYIWLYHFLKAKIVYLSFILTIKPFIVMIYSIYLLSKVPSALIIWNP